MTRIVVDVTEGREDWREVLERLELARVVEERAGAAAVARTLERISAWTGDTAP